MMDELESQNDAHVEGILGKVRTLKSVGHPSFLLVERLVHRWRSLRV